MVETGLYSCTYGHEQNIMLVYIAFNNGERVIHSSVDINYSNPLKVGQSFNDSWEKFLKKENKLSMKGYEEFLSQSRKKIVKMLFLGWFNII